MCLISKTLLAFIEPTGTMFHLSTELKPPTTPFFISAMPSSTHHGPTHHTKPSPDYMGALFHFHNAPTSRRKRAPSPKPMYSNSTFYFHPFSSGCNNINFTTSSDSLSTLHICILTKACRLASPIVPPHSHLCLLFGNTQQASAPHFLRGALYHLQNASEPGRKRAPPQTCVFYFLLLPLSEWLRCQLHPIEVLFARCWPIT